MSKWKSYFHNRKVCVRGGLDEVEWRNVSRGCPQGSICGPFIWNMMMDMLLNQLEQDGCKVCAYADDLLFLVECNSKEIVGRQGCRWMLKVSEWGQGVGVAVSVEKTLQILLRGFFDRGRPPTTRLNCRCVRYEREVKYLGVWMTERMNFGVHVAR